MHQGNKKYIDLFEEVSPEPYQNIPYNKT